MRFCPFASAFNKVVTAQEHVLVPARPKLHRTL